MLPVFKCRSIIEVRYGYLVDYETDDVFAALVLIFPNRRAGEPCFYRRRLDFCMATVCILLLYVGGTN